MLLSLQAYGKVIKEIEGSALMAVVRAFFDGNLSELLRKRQFIHHFYLLKLAQKYCIYKKQLNQSIIEFVQLGKVVTHLKDK